VGKRLLIEHFRKFCFHDEIANIFEFMDRLNSKLIETGVIEDSLEDSDMKRHNDVFGEEGLSDEDESEESDNENGENMREFWKDFKKIPEGQEQFQLDDRKQTVAINGIDHVLFVQNNLKNCEFNYAGAVVVNTSSKYVSDAIAIDFQSLYPTETILLNIDSSSLAYWSEFKIYIRCLDKYVDPFDSNFIRAEACQIKINSAYVNICAFFIRPEIQKSLTSILQIDLAQERSRVRKLMNGLDKRKEMAKYLFYDANQLAIKRIMNSIYGTTASNLYSSYSLFVASEITKKGRNQLFSLFMYSYWYCWQRNLFGLLEIVYGDTDSLFTSFDKNKLTFEYMIKLAYEYKRYPMLHKLYENSQRLGNENDFEKLVRNRYRLDCLDKWLDFKLYNWQIDEFGEVNRVSSVRTQSNTIRELFAYEGEDKWEKRWEGLIAEPRAFDKTILIYIQHDILHKYSLLPRNRVMLDGHSWNDLVFDNRENEHEFIGASNIDNISKQIVSVNLERQLSNLFVFKKKNYVGTVEQQVGEKPKPYFKGSIAFNSKQSIPIKNFLHKIWEIFGDQTKYLNQSSISKIYDAFDEYFKCPDSYFYINCKIGKKLTEYKNTNIWINQLKKINSLGLDKLDVGDCYLKTYYNYFFEGPFIFKKIDKKNVKHLKYLKEKKESNMLIQNLVPQVQQKLTETDLIEFKKSLLTHKHSAVGFEYFLAKKHFYKLNIKDLKLDKEIILYKSTVAVMTEYFKCIETQNNYYLDFQCFFETIWHHYFGSTFATKLNSKKKLNFNNNINKITKYFSAK